MSVHPVGSSRGRPNRNLGASCVLHLCSALGVTRTLNLLIRSQMLYPLSYERLCREMSVVGRPEMQRRQLRKNALKSCMPTGA
jgi:hypothetical protein